MDSLPLNHENYYLQNDPVLAEYLLTETVEQTEGKPSLIHCQLRRKTNLKGIQREPLRQQALKFNR